MGIKSYLFLWQVLTIAHRLNTVLACDRVMVMADGRVLEVPSYSITMDTFKSSYSITMDTVKSSYSITMDTVLACDRVMVMADGRVLEVPYVFLTMDYYGLLCKLLWITMEITMNTVLACDRVMVMADGSVLEVKEHNFKSFEFCFFESQGQNLALAI